jgi:hypothetical protein
MEPLLGNILLAPVFHMSLIDGNVTDRCMVRSGKQETMMFCFVTVFFFCFTLLLNYVLYDKQCSFCWW